MASEHILGVYEAENKKSEEEIKKEYDLRLDLASYLTNLEQENIREKVLDEYKKAYDDEIEKLFNYLNTKDLSDDDIRNIESKSVLKSIIAVSIDDAIPPLTEENLELVKNKVDDYMAGGILIENPILSQTSGDKTYQKSELLNLMYAILGSRNFTNANITEHESYGEIIKEASEVLEDELADTQTIDLAYKSLMADARDINEKLKEDSEETQAEAREVDPDINQESDFYKNPEYRGFYLALTKDKRDELDQMRNTPAKKPYLTIKQLLSINKYGLPVYDTDWPYPFMYDKNNNGMVGESYQEDAIANDENLARSYRETSLENRFIINKLDTNKDGYIDEDELMAAGLVLDDENNRWIISFMRQSDHSSETTTQSPIPQTTVLENKETRQSQTDTNSVAIEEAPKKELIQNQEANTITMQAPINNQANVKSNSNVSTGISGSSSIIALGLITTMAYFKSKNSK